MRQPTQLRVCKAIAAIAAINFVAYMIVSAHLGGDAINGMIEDGHYFLAQHGRYTEVSAAIFTLSRWHTYSVWCTHPLGMLAIVWHHNIRNIAGRPGPGS